MTGRVQQWVLPIAASTICGAAASAAVAVVASLLGAPSWLSLIGSLAACCYACWRVGVWNERQDELEANRAEVDR